MNESKPEIATAKEPGSELRVFVSRNFTEFGGFTPEEVIALYQRDVFLADDSVRLSTTDEWLPLHDWLSGATSAEAVSSQPSS